MNARKHIGLILLTFVVPGIASAQVPDLLNALDAGGRAMGVGGASRATDSTTQSALDNPAGLAFISEPTASISFRNLPKSTTLASGNFNDRTNSTDETSGRIALSHVGYATPFAGGTLGVSYTIGGHMDAVTTGNNLPNNTLSVRNLEENMRAQTDFFTLSFGRQQGGLNVGIGLVVANQYVKYSQSYLLFDGNTQVGSSNISASDNGIGVGIVAGVQGYMGADNGTAWGISVRTPIDLNGNTETSGIYDKIPGKASFGIGGQLNRFSRGEDFLVWLAQIDYYFGGDEDLLFSRKNYATYGFGFEYNMHRYNARIPVRLGLSILPSGGNGFDSRDALTFGLGYRPIGKPYSIDLNFARAFESGKMDIGLGITFKPGN